MDKHTLTTILITAAITQTANLLANWLLTAARSTATSAIVKAKASRIFNKTTRSLAFDGALSLLFIAVIIASFSDRSPVTRVVVVQEALYVLCAFISAAALMARIMLLRVQRAALFSGPGE